MYQKYKIGQIFGKLTRKKKNIKSFRIHELKSGHINTVNALSYDDMIYIWLYYLM